MVTIEKFCESFKIDRVKGKYGYSDLYVDVSKRYKSEVRSYYATEADGSSCKHMFRYYMEGDLKEYFKEVYGFTQDIPSGALEVSDVEGIK